MSAADRQSLSFVPLTPSGGGFAARRAYGMGVAFALAEVVTAGGFPVSVRNFSPPDADDTAAALLAGALGGRRWTAVAGYYDPEEVRPLRLVKIPPAASEPVGEREFADADLLRCAAEVASWLGESGAGEDSSRPHELLPGDWGELKADAWCHAVGWLLSQVKSVVDEEYLSTLAEAMRFFAAHVEDPYAGRRLRELLISSVDTMLLKREPDLNDLTAEMVERIADQLDPAGMELIWPVLDEGVRRGADPAAFRALRGFLNMELGRPEEALPDFEAVRQEGLARPALFALAQAYDQLDRADEAEAAVEEAIRMTRPGEPFTDIVRGRDAGPEPDGRTWLGLLLGARAYAELRDSRFAEAERTAQRALEEGGHPVNTLSILARVYGEWAVALLEEDAARNAGRGAELLRKNLEVLDRIFAVEPRREEAEAGIGAASFLDDAGLEALWRRRLSEVGGGAAE